MGHDHSHHLGDDEPGGPIARSLRIVVVVVVVLAGVALVALWPRGDAPDLGLQPQEYVDAEVRDVFRDQCLGDEAPTIGCRTVDVRVTSGPTAGQDATFYVLDTELEVPELAVGDRIVLTYVATSPEGYQYRYEDRQRDIPLLGLTVLFAVVVVAFGRWQGLRALLGLAISGVVLVAFLVPALLRDEPAVLVALVAGTVIAAAALYLAHGVSTATTVALIGTLLSLLVVTLLALAATSWVQLVGLSSEESQVLRITADALDLRGLLVAGIVVGALGILDDVTVTQVSTVAALRRANPRLGPRALHREAMSVGRDHVASAVNTLVLAYAGASLPLLLFFAQSTRPAGSIIAKEIVAVEVVRMLVGSIGLIASVPITTALAAWVLGARADADGDDDGPSWDDFAPDAG